MKAYISRSAWEPCFYLDFGESEDSMEISDELRQRYMVVLEAFDAVQAELEKLYYAGRT